LSPRIVSRLADEVHCGCKGNTFLRNFWVLQIRLQTKKHVNKGILKGKTAQNTSKFSKLLTSGVKVGLGVGFLGVVFLFLFTFIGV
ncbi:MAG: hypothetical protein II949_04265, partial [Prevotella sp.]|nr:hypothetical protein [Prevotella sp.]